MQDKSHPVFYYCMHAHSEADAERRLLTDDERIRLNTNLPQLIRQLEPDELCNELLAVEVIGHLQCEHIRSQTTRIDKNIELVDILVRRSFADYRQFLKTLQATGQSHVADVLINGGGRSTVKYSLL